MLWTEAEELELRRMHEAGHSGEAIARSLHKTRNSIQGKIDRIGLSRHTGHGQRNPLGRNQHKNGVSTVPLQPDLQQPAAPAHVEFVNLENWHCRWPVGPMTFCGQHKVEDYPYCAEHCKLAYTKRPS